MKKRRFIFFLAAVNLFFVFSFSLIALEWPVKVENVSSNFGQSLGRSFNKGIYVPGKDQAVYPIAPGEVIFSYDEGTGFSSIPRGLGSMVILYHDGNLHTIYGHLEEGSFDCELKQVSTAQPIGLIGNTGATPGGVLALYIVDVEENIFLNPQSRLTPLPQDNLNPVVEGVFLRRGDILIKLKNNLILSPGEGEILVKVYDRRRDEKGFIQLLGVARASLNLNGREIGMINFDSLVEEENVLVLSGNRKKLEDLFDQDGNLILGEVKLIEGRTHLQIVAEDYPAGTPEKTNQTIKDLFLTVRN